MKSYKFGLVLLVLMFFTACATPLPGSISDPLGSPDSVSVPIAGPGGLTGFEVEFPLPDFQPSLPAEETVFQPGMSLEDQLGVAEEWATQDTYDVYPGFIADQSSHAGSFAPKTDPPTEVPDETLIDYSQFLAHCEKDYTGQGNHVPQVCLCLAQLFSVGKDLDAKQYKTSKFVFASDLRTIPLDAINIITEKREWAFSLAIARDFYRTWTAADETGQAGACSELKLAHLQKELGENAKPITEYMMVSVFAVGKSNLLPISMYLVPKPTITNWACKWGLRIILYPFPPRSLECELTSWPEPVRFLP